MKEIASRTSAEQAVKDRMKLSRRIQRTAGAVGLAAGVFMGFHSQDSSRQAEVDTNASLVSMAGAAAIAGIDRHLRRKKGNEIVSAYKHWRESENLPTMSVVRSGGCKTRADTSGTGFITTFAPIAAGTGSLILTLAERGQVLNHADDSVIGLGVTMVATAVIFEVIGGENESRGLERSFLKQIDNLTVPAEAIQ